MAIKNKHKHAVGIILLLLSWAFALTQTRNVSAASNTPAGPDRFTYIPVDYITYQWWMLTWADSELVCKLNIEHEGLPTLSEVYVECGEGLSAAWFEQEVCTPDIYSNNTSDCPGYYWHLASSTSVQKDIAIALPPPMVWLTMQDCTVEDGTNRCERPPTLVLRGEEPISGEEILRINGNIGTESFSCQNSLCEQPLSETDDSGMQITFWANSSYGDSSNIFNAHLRVKYMTDESEPYWYVDVLSSQWRGEANPSCAESWDAFPPIGGLPDWLTTPDDLSGLESDFDYAYLAGNLIEKGIVNASQCIDFGIDSSGQATPCGLEVAQPAMIEWQNRFDQLIMDAAQETSVPAVLLKRLFARESQFWPGIFNAGADVGLGQLTIEGADFTFLWNPIFFEQFCPLALDEEACAGGYLHLDTEQQEHLRGALVYSVNATCDTCPLGVDLAQADFSVNVFANTLHASCEQTGYVVYNNTGVLAGQAASYEDLWMFTLVNYNAGAGCLGLAIDATLDASQELNWDNLSQNLTSVCAGTKGYVEDISE